MIDKAKQKLKEYKNFVLAALIGVSAVGAFLYFRPEPPKNPKQPDSTNQSSNADQSKQVSQGRPAPESNQEKSLVKVINRLKTILNGDSISYEAVKKIYESQFQLSRQEFKTKILASRRERRNYLANLVDYEKNYMKYERQIQEIHNKHLNAVLAHFRIDKGGWMELTQGVAAQHSEQWNQFLIESEEQELELIRDKDKPKIKLSTLIQIEKYRLKMLKQKINQFKMTFSKSDKSDLYIVVQKWGFDNIYTKFHVEEEDINYSRQQLSEEEKENLQKYEEDIRDIMGGLMCDDEHRSESEENGGLQHVNDY